VATSRRGASAREPAAKADDAVASALLAKRNPVLIAALDQEGSKGNAEGRAEGKLEALFAVLAARGLTRIFADKISRHQADR